MYESILIYPHKIFINGSYINYIYIYILKYYISHNEYEV